MSGSVRFVHNAITFSMAGRVFRPAADGSCLTFSLSENIRSNAGASFEVMVRSSRGEVLDRMETLACARSLRLVTCV